MIGEILHISMVVYLIAALLSFYTAYEFYKTKNGKLRKALIFLFAGLGIGLTIRGSWGLLELQERVNLNPYVSLIAITIVLIVLVLFLITIKKMEKQ